MTTIDYNTQTTTIPQTPKKAERLTLALEKVFFLPETMVHLIEPDPTAICIGIRSKEYRARRYHPELKAHYAAEGVPHTVTDPDEQRKFEHPPLDRHLTHDRIYINKQLMHGISNFLRENIAAKTLYVNCSLGETRSYALACSVANHLGFDAMPYGEHVRPECAYTNNDLHGLFEMMMYRNFKGKY